MPFAHAGFASILEAKNYSGTLDFLPDGQLIRTVANRREGFPNPLLQVKRHRDLLTKWIAANRFPVLPIEPQVAIASPLTIIKNPANLRTVCDWVTHAEQIPSRINQFINKYPKKLTPQTLSLFDQQLLHAHTDPPLDVLSRFKIRADAMQRGVRCTQCNRFSMRRAYGTWICGHCGHACKTAHEPMILDYFLLFGPTMTNRQCREFLRIEDRQLVRRILKKMRLDPIGNGTGNGLYYVRPSRLFYHNYYLNHNRKS